MERTGLIEARNGWIVKFGMNDGRIEYEVYERLEEAEEALIGHINKLKYVDDPL